MNSLDEWTKLIGALGVTGGVLLGIVRAMVKRFPPKATGLAAEVATLKSDVGDLRRDMRLLTDYVHDLREDYARDTGKAPRDWPEGLRL